jgi:hypothetical protein
MYKVAFHRRCSVGRRDFTFMRKTGQLWRIYFVSFFGKEEILPQIWQESRHKQLKC